MALETLTTSDSSMDEGGPDPALHRKHGSTRRAFSDPIHVIDDKVDVWNELWQRHNKISTPVPDGVVWDSLAVLSCDDIRGLLCH